MLDRWAGPGPPVSLDARGSPDASRESVDATSARDPAAEVRGVRLRPGDRPCGGRGAQYGAAVPGPGSGGRPDLAAAGDADGRCAGGAAVCGRRGGCRATAQGRARLGRGAPGTTPARRDADAVVGRVPGQHPGWLPVQPLVRVLPRLGGPSVAGDATGPSGWRAAVRRLRRADGGGDRACHRRGAHGAGVRGGAGGVELHLCRGGVDC